MRIGRILFTVSFFAASAFSADPSYVFHDLIFPNPPGNTTSSTAAYGINDNGTVVGYYQTQSTGNEKFGFYGSTYTGVSLLTLNLGAGSPACTPNSTVGVFPTGINNSGTIVGTASFSGTGCSTNNGFITGNVGSTFTDFAPSGVLPTGYTLLGDFATAINNSDVIVGYAIGRLGTSFPFDGYTTPNETSFTAVFDTNVGQTGATLPAGINASGEVVGFYFNSSNVQVGFLFSGGHYYDVIPSISGVIVTASDATSIDTNGDIVGFYKDSSGVSHGFIWTGYIVSGSAISGGTVTTLDDTNAGTNGGNGEGTQILGISPDGKELVGLYKNSSGTNGFYAMSSITTVISSANPSASGMSVTFTASVNPSSATGTITLVIDGVSQSAVTLSGGQATFATSALFVGSHNIQATYSGDSNNGSSTSNIFSQTVSTASTVSLSSSTGSPSALNQSVTFIATVPANATGTITFILDGGMGVPVTITNGRAQFTPPILSAGTHVVRASYSGDANFSAASATFTQVVSQTAVGTVTLTSSSNPATYGLVVTFVASVPTGATGTITFTVDGRSQSPITLTGTQAQFAASNLSVGNHSITATYSGNSSFQGASSPVLTEVINHGLGNVGISASPSPSTSGQSVTFLATVPVGTTGSITFSVDGVIQTTVAVTSGQASFSTASLTIGSHTITATYSGDANFAAGSNSVTQMVSAPAPPLLSLTSSQNPSVVGQPVTFTVAVSSAAIVSAVNGIPVAFYDGTTPLGIATAQNGQASLTTSALLAGSHTIIAQVPGTGVQLTMGQVVNGMPTATTITAAPSPGVSGQPTTLTALVGPAAGKPPAGTPAPTGQITFQDNGSPVGTANLSATGATLTVNHPAAGTHQFTAIYSGDKFWGSSFGRVSDAINAPTVQLSSAAAPMSAGFSPDEAVSIYNVPGLTGDTTSSLPLGSSLAGVTVTVTDSAGVSRQAQIYGVYASAGQINLVIPAGSATGQATVTITLPRGNTAQATVTIANIAPAIYTASMNGTGVFAGQIVYVQPDGTQTIASSADPVTFTSGGQVFLTLYGTGIRHYASGVTATVNGVSVPAQAAAQPTYPGLDQINLGPLPASLAGAGIVNLVITMDGQTANTVTVTTTQ